MRVNVNFKFALMASTIGLVAVSLGVSNYFSFQELKETTIDSAKVSISSNIDSQANLISEFLSDKIDALDKLAELKKSGEISNDVLFSKVSVDAMNSPFFGVGYNDGSAVGTFDNYVTPEGYDARKRPWFQAAKRTNKVAFTDVYQDFSSGQNIMSIAKDFGEGVILADLSLDILNGAVESLAVNNAFGVVITEDGVALASTSSGFKVGDKMDDFRGLKDMFARFKGHESMFLEYSFDGYEKYAATHRINVGEKSWYIISGISGADLFKEVEASGQRAIISTLSTIVLSIVVVFLLLKVVYTPILQLRDTLHELSSGEADFTQRLTVTNEKDDLGKITHYVNKLIENSQNMMKQISSVSESLGHVITDIKESSNNNSAILAEHVAQTEQVVTAIEEMNVTSRTVAQNAAEAASETQSANQVGIESRSVVEQAQNSVVSLVEEVQTAADRVENMSQETQNISSITDVIGGIAEQTNLLALNAAIEAARAGEQGRGFAVVADEVRALAARTQTSTSEIDDAVNSLTSGSSAVVSVMDETKNACEQTAEQTSMVSNSLDELSNAIERINEITEQIATAAEQQTSVSEEISQSMAEISEIANTVNSNIGGMTSSVESMAKMYDQLTAIVGNSKI